MGKIRIVNQKSAGAKVSAEFLSKLEDSVSRSSGFFKIVCGIGNNAAWMFVLEAWDHLRGLDLHRRVSGGNSLGGEFRRVFKAFERYERGLIYADRNRFFRLSDLSPEQRKRWGVISDRDYYDMWSSIGAKVYTDQRLFATCLVNKYRLLYERNEVSGALSKAWGVSALHGLFFAVESYRSALRTVTSNVPGLDRSAIERIFRGFSLESIARMWFQCLRDLDSSALMLGLDGVSDKNIGQSIEQLQESWFSASSFRSGLSGTLEGYADLFRTPGEMKKALRAADSFSSELEKEEQASAGNLQG